MIRRYFMGLLVLLVTLIILFTGLAILAGHTPAPISTLFRGAARLATPRG